jgi:hypothetical protein
MQRRLRSAGFNSPHSGQGRSLSNALTDLLLRRHPFRFISVCSVHSVVKRGAKKRNARNALNKPEMKEAAFQTASLLHL